MYYKRCTKSGIVDSIIYVHSVLPVIYFEGFVEVNRVIFGNGSDDIY